MSNLVGKHGGEVLAKYLALPLLQFGIGVLLGALGFALRYLSQACYSESNDPQDKLHRCGDWLRYSAIFVAVSGYILFGFAVGNSYHAVLWSFGG
jgi:hypothetical protein